jgi:hypothetical protein
MPSRREPADGARILFAAPIGLSFGSGACAVQRILTIVLVGLIVALDLVNIRLSLRPSGRKR